jgi:hypothetical protein
VKRKNIVAVGFLAVGPTMVGPSLNCSENPTAQAIATRRETDSDVPHTHIENIEPDPLISHTLSALGASGNRNEPFIPSSAMDAANVVAVRACYDRSRAAYQVAALSAVPSQCHLVAQP